MARQRIPYSRFGVALPLDSGCDGFGTLGGHGFQQDFGCGHGWPQPANSGAAFAGRPPVGTVCVGIYGYFLAAVFDSRQATRILVPGARALCAGYAVLLLVL